MKHHSIYTSLYNANKMGFPWKETLDNWTKFLNGDGQIVIAVNMSTDGTFWDVSDYTNELKKLPNNNVEYTVIMTHVPYEDPLFDGKIKDLALKQCNRQYCTLLDIDEVLPLSTRHAWEQSMSWLTPFGGYEVLMIPVIDLFHDENHFKSIGSKWYLHLNSPNLHRGRVNFAARPDGTTDIQKSDTCELIRSDGNLAFAGALMGGNLDKGQLLFQMEKGYVPYVVHLGWLNKEQRLRQSAFWAPVWNARNGSEVEKPLTQNELDKVAYYRHNLKHWNTE